MAGFITPKKAIRTYAQQALIRGAVLRQNEKVITWKQETDHIIVKTDKGSYHTEKLILTAGPYIQSLLPTFTPQLTVTRQLLGWLNPLTGMIFLINEFPCWVIEEEEYQEFIMAFQFYQLKNSLDP